MWLLYLMKRKKKKQELQSAVNLNIKGEEDLNIPVLLQEVEPMIHLSIEWIELNWNE